jgi:uncharacterized membrane protein
MKKLYYIVTKLYILEVQTMNVSNSELRARAHAALGSSIFDKKWFIAIAISAIIPMVLTLVSNISCGIGSFLLSGPLYVGLHIAYLKLIRNEEFKIGNAFEGCNDFGSNLMLGLMYSLIVMLWSLLCVVPGILKSYSYAMIYYIKADHPEYGWKECLDESEKMMKGNRWKLFTLQLSFIGWAFVAFFTCGIGSFWVSAYSQTANAAFYEELKAAQTYSYTAE